MQKFRNNLITPELAAKLIENSLNSSFIISTCSSEFQDATEKQKKRFIKLHEKEEKKVQSLLDCVFLTEFWTDEHDWYESIRVHVGRNSVGDVLVIICLEFNGTYPCRDPDQEDRPTFEEASRWALEAIKFFSSIKSKMFFVSCEMASIKCCLFYDDENLIEKVHSKLIGGAT
jgi:hypothetical protein